MLLLSYVLFFLFPTVNTVCFVSLYSADQVRDYGMVEVMRMFLEGCTRYHAWPQLYDHRPSHPYNAGTEHVGFSRTRQTLLAPSAKRREVFGEPHEG